MRKLAAIVLGSMFLFSCSGDSKQATAKKQVTTDTVLQKFFPLTDFLKGEIRSISTKGVNPLKVITTGDKKDSSWLKLEELGTALQEFVTPVIDSTNLTSWYTETKFLDQTLNTFTFTYDPKKVLPDTMQLLHWDVYIDPESGTVKKVYLLKRSGEKTLQLTWQTGKSCKIITLAKKPDGNNGVEKEETILWNFNSQ